MLTNRQRILTLADDGHEAHVIAAILGFSVEDVVRALTEPAFLPVEGEVEREWLRLADIPHGLAADDRYLYYLLHDGPDHIGRVALDGSDNKPAWLASAEINAVAVDATHVYWSSVEAPAAIGRARLDGSLIEPEWVKLGASPGTTIAVGGGFIYFGLGGGLARVRLDGSGLEEAWRGVGNVQALTADASFIYWATEGGGIGRARLSGAAPEDEWQAQVATGLAVGGGYLYWVHQALIGVVTGANDAGRVRADGTELLPKWRAEWGLSGSTSVGIALSGNYLYSAVTAGLNAWLDRALL